MTVFQAILLGIIQGLTEFLPISSSGHLEIGHALLGIHNENNLLFVLDVHLATVLSTIVVFRKDIAVLIKDLLKFEWNTSTKYVSMLLVSSVPIVIIGLLFKAEIENAFNGNLLLVGCMLIITAFLLTLTAYVPKNSRKMTFSKAFVTGIAQMLAVLPGISRSGATIATGLLMGVKKDEVARFSFLMVLIPIIGASILDLAGGEITAQSVNTTNMLAGFIAAFVTGVLACSWMIRIVKGGKLIYFAIYCALIGLIAIFAA